MTNSRMGVDELVDSVGLGPVEFPHGATKNGIPYATLASAQSRVTTIVATALQTVFPVDEYAPGTSTVSVYLNGVLLSSGDYVETDDTTITLTVGAAEGDIFVCKSTHVLNVLVGAADNISYTPEDGTPTSLSDYLDGLEASQVRDAVLESELSDTDSTVSIAGFDANLVAANRNASGFNRYAAGAGVAQSSAIGADWDFTHVNTTGFLSSNVTRNGSWLGAADTFTWVEVNLPVGVIIGDSIAEGHGSPDRHGRLHTGTVPIFDLAALNVAGQPAYHLAEKTGMYWFNHGIGGQTSTQVLERWSRDALGNTVAVGDGRPDTTLDQKPYCVWVNVGINDISTNVDPAVTKENLLNMAKSARDNGIIVGFNTVGPNNTHTAGQIQQQKDLSSWMLETLPRFGAYVFDFRTWFDNPASPDTVNPLLAADSVHPRGAGYISYVSELIKQTAAPIVMEKICVESKVDPDGTPTNYVLLKQLRVEHVASGVDFVANVANLEAHISPIFDMTNTRSLRFYPSETSGFPVSGTNRVAISRVYGVFGNKKQSLPDSRRAFAMLKSVSAVYSVETTYPRENVIDVTIISTTHLRVRFTRPVRNVKITAQGSTRPYDFSVAVLTSPNREVVVYVIDKTTGAAIDPNTASGTFFFSVDAI